ncbi:conserved hypothetical protein [Gammaproteobacteria bacterium]
MGVKISSLPIIVTPALSDVFPVVQAGVTYKESFTQLSSLFATAGANSNITSLSGLTTPLSAAQGGTGVITGLPIINGQLPIGNGTNYTLATLTAGPGISIANASGSITIAGTGSGIGWTEITGVTQAGAADNGYVANNAALVTITLPATAAFGTVISVIGKGAGGWLLAQNALQNIQIGSVSSTVGVGGSVASSNRYDSLDLICTTANTIWTIQGGGQTAGFTIV